MLAGNIILWCVVLVLWIAFASVSFFSWIDLWSLGGQVAFVVCAVLLHSLILAAVRWSRRVVQQHLGHHCLGSACRHADCALALARRTRATAGKHVQVGCLPLCRANLLAPATNAHLAGIHRRRARDVPDVLVPVVLSVTYKGS